MTDIERYLAANTHACPPMLARISRRQCGTLIKSGDITHCAQCPEASLADMSGPERVTAWGLPRKTEQPQTPAKVTTMHTAEDRDSKEYTLKVIAAKAGVKIDCMWAAMKYVKAGQPERSGNAAKVQAVLDELGIPWWEIKGIKGKKDAAAAPSAPVSDVTPVHAKPEAPELPLIPPQEATESATLSSLLTDYELQHTLENKLAGTQKAETIGAMIPMEELLDEIRSRLPVHAKLTIQL